MRDLTGIETRTDTKGVERCRGFIKERGAKVRGPWGTYADAKAWRARAISTKLDGGSVAKPKGQTIAEASEKFLAGAEAGLILSRKDIPYAPKTVRGYRQAFRDYVVPELGHIPVAALRRSQVQRWVDWVASQRGAGTTRNTWAALAALYSWLLPRHDDIADPTDGVRLPRPGKPRQRYAEPEEMVELLEALPLPLALPYALAFYAGLRRAEIQALRWCDVESQWVCVRRSLDPVEGFKDAKSEAGLREVPLFGPLRPLLDAQRLECSASLVLPSTRRSRWGTRSLGTPFLRKCEALWTPLALQTIGLHEARHSFATAADRAGYPLTLISEWMGHAQVSTTANIYVKRRRRQEGLTEKMDSYLIGAR